MAHALPLGEFEQTVLLAVMQAGRAGEAYGVTIHSEIEARTGRRVARGAVYLTLDRLEKKGLLDSHATAPIPERGGRARRCYTVTRSAMTALGVSRRALLRLWEGLTI